MRPPGALISEGRSGGLDVAAAETIISERLTSIPLGPPRPSPSIGRHTLHAQISPTLPSRVHGTRGDTPPP